jgi:hypothetical protein
MRPRVAPRASALEAAPVALPPAPNGLAGLAIAGAVAALVTTALLTLSSPAERATATLLARWRARRGPRAQ